jgi:hypothetical protein
MLRLLDPHDEIAQQLLSSQHKLNSFLSWGLGIGLESVEGEACFWHWGENGSFENFIWGNPATGDGIIILTNSSKGLKICERLVRAVTGHDLVAFLWL